MRIPLEFRRSSFSDKALHAKDKMKRYEKFRTFSPSRLNSSFSAFPAVGSKKLQPSLVTQGVRIVEATMIDGTGQGGPVLRVGLGS
jgi:hypothetical protein